MKCKRHPYEVGPGVCASCLRDRLLDVLDAQIALADTPRRRPEPILLPTSISPHRRSVDSAGPRHHLLFFSTPQVAPSSTATATARRSRSFLSSLFSHHRSHEHHPDPEKSKRSGSISWISALIPGRRRRKKTKVSSPPPVRIACRDRGMSPAEEEDDDFRDTVSESGYSTEASGMSRRTMPTPMRAVHHHQHHQHHQHRSSGFGGFMCLSPLVRTSPAGRRCHAAPASEIGFSGELRPVLAHPRSGGTAGDSFGPNRSRKLADFGRFR